VARQLGEREDRLVGEIARFLQAGDARRGRACAENGDDDARERSSRPSTASVVGPVKRPAPGMTSTPSCVRRSTPSCGAMPARTSRMRAMTAGKSTWTLGTRIPNRAASRAEAATRAAPIKAFDGTQPKLRQSPPSRCFSTNATFAPNPAAPMADTNPAVPPPTTTRL
jgi:hypothetical protein